MSDSSTKAPADLRKKLKSAAAMPGFLRLRSRSWWVAGRDKVPDPCSLSAEAEACAAQKPWCHES